MVAAALALSEEYDTPVLLLVSTRISHAHSIVELGPERDSSLCNDGHGYRIDIPKYVMVPAHARQRHSVVEARMRRIAAGAESLPWNRVEMGDTRLGIITHSVAYQYAREVFPEASFLRLGMTYPLSRDLLADFARRVDRLIVVEELDPVIEEELAVLGIRAEGKSIFPLEGELSPETVRECAIDAGLLPESARPERVSLTLPDLPSRPPVLCPGCRHRGISTVANRLKLVVNGDIGCYTLGFLPPLSAVHSTGCMGASIGVAHGVTRAGINQKHIAVIGDSTFFHTGLQALLNTAYNESNTTTVIVDNRTTAMTGHQQHPGTGRTLQGRPAREADIEAVVRALGIDQVTVVDPYDLDAVEQALRTATEASGPAVIISRRECALLPEARARYAPLQVDEDVCIACGACRRLGCPAMGLSDSIYERTGRPKSRIDPLLCTGCKICAQICPRDGIVPRANEAETL